MKIERVELIHIKLRMKEPFYTGCGVVIDRPFVIVKAYGEGLVGYGEAAANHDPIYSYETTGTCLHILRDFLIPAVLDKEIGDAADLMKRLEFCRGHNMAKAGLEMAFWDLFSQSQGLPLCRAVGGRDIAKIDVGLTVGIRDKVEDTIEEIRGFLSVGYKRTKVKIKPGSDVRVIERIRKEFGDIALMADANSSYCLEDAAVFKELDKFNLMMIEQPLDYEDIVDHAELQRQIKTPLCLDESIHGVDDARKAIKLKSCRIINIKVARVGGLWEAKRVHDLCQANDIPVWCGSMIQTGIGEAVNIAVSTLKNYTLPGDTLHFDRFFNDDIIEPKITVNPDGTIDVPRKPGLGFKVSEEKLRKYCVAKEVVA